MNRLKVVRVLLLLLMLAGVFLMLADPVHAIVHFVSNAIPPALLLSLWLGAPATRREKKEFDEERKQKLEAARDGHRVSDEELADARRRFEESLGKPVVVLPPGVPAALGAAVSTAEFAENLKAFQESVHAAKAELEYVPAGQAELSNDLMECLARQVDEANRTRWSAGRKRWSAGRKREWHISPEWLEEVRKLKSGGKPVWRPRQREECDPLPGYLLGYPVVVADHFGIPELTAV